MVEHPPKSITHISVLIVTRGACPMIEAVLSSLKDFEDIHICHTGDATHIRQLLCEYGFHLSSFEWNGKYPKKRQWCLDNLPLKNDWVFMVDADEIVTEELVNEMRTLELKGCAGYFIKGRYFIDGQKLEYGFQNNKLCLFNHKEMTYPVIDDLKTMSMGEIEGHYQPVLKLMSKSLRIGQIVSYINHYVSLNNDSWHKRHEKYAEWEAYMIRGKAHPKDPITGREYLKFLFRHIPFRASIAFLHSYIWRQGFRDGMTGFRWSQMRYFYYTEIQKNLKIMKQNEINNINNKTKRI